MIGVMSSVLGEVEWEWGGEGQPRESEQSGQTSQAEQKAAGQWGEDTERKGEAGQVVSGPDPIY